MNKYAMLFPIYLDLLCLNLEYVYFVLKTKIKGLGNIL